MINIKIKTMIEKKRQRLANRMGCASIESLDREGDWCFSWKGKYTLPPIILKYLLVYT